VGLLQTNDQPDAETFLNLTSYNAHTRQTSYSRQDSNPPNPASERPHTHILDGAVTGIGIITIIIIMIIKLISSF
jgi:hypothetical protein